MSPRIEKTSLATRDLEGLAGYYLTEAGISLALRFLDNASRAFTLLSRMPRMGALVGFRQPQLADIRRWHIEDFPRLLVLYRPRPDGIEVIRVIDAGRDITTLFSDPRLSQP